MSKTNAMAVALLTFLFFCAFPLRAGYFTSAEQLNVAYDLSKFTIPATVGATTDWAAVSEMLYSLETNGVTGSYIDTQIGGGITGDGVTWITTNAGVGVQFKLTDVNGCLPETTTPPYIMQLPANTVCVGSAIKVSYRLVRLADYVPSGPVSMPNVQMIFNNYNGAPVATVRAMYYSGASNQPYITPCIIDVPAVVRLDDLPSANIQVGAINMKNVPVTLSQCPGAITNIRYLFQSSYGSHDTAVGTINTKPGSAAGVYFQLLRSPTENYRLTQYYALSEYNGSGDYSIPLNVAYYVDAPSQVTLGDVESALTLVVNYQ